MNQPTTIDLDEILTHLQTASLYAENTEPGMIVARDEAKQAILSDLLALPVAQDEVSQKLTQSNQEWAKYAHIRNAIRQEWRKALTDYFEGEV